MAKCCVCSLNTREARSCTVKQLRFLPYEIRHGRHVVSLDKASYLPRLAYGDDKLFPSDTVCCPDCGVKRGGYHHPGCKWEECPRCHEQLLTCECEDGEWDNVPAEVTQ